MSYASQGQLKTIAQAINDNYAKKDGSYETLTSGQTHQLISTVGVEDNTPYSFRTSGGFADIGNRENDKLVGGTIAWNQVLTPSAINNINMTEFNGITCSKHSDGHSITATGTCTDSVYDKSMWRILGGDSGNLIIGHKYTFVSQFKYTGRDVRLYIDYGGRTAAANEIFTAIQETASIYLKVSVGYSISQTFTAMLIDLTQMFGSTIADYIYSLEQATAGAGVAWFKNLFPKPYYAYNAGELMSVCTNAHITRGFNAWDEEWESGMYNTLGNKISNVDDIRVKNFIPVVPNSTYHIKTSLQTGRVNLYDANKNFIKYVYPSSSTMNFNTDENTHYITTYWTGTTYNHDICINLSWSGYRNGEYEPYVEHRYPLSPIELRGIPKLDSANNLYFDGDTYEKDGKVTRKYGIVDLGTLNWITRGGSGSYPETPCFQSTDIQNLVKRGTSANIANIMCTKYDRVSWITLSQSSTDKIISVAGDGFLNIRDTNYTTAAAFKSAMSGVYLVCELATPTTETADPFADPQIVDDFGTEEYVDALATAETSPRDVAVPVGHETLYQANLRDKLQNAPNMPAESGDFLMHYDAERRTAEYVKYSQADAVVERRKYAFEDGDNGYVRKWSKDTDGKAFVECGFFTTTVSTGETTVAIPFTYDSTNYFVEANAVELGNFHVCAFPVDGSHISIRASGVSGSTYVAIPISIQIKGYTQVN